MWWRNFDEGMVDFLVQFRGTVYKLPFDILDEFLHLALHFFHPLPHVKDNLDTRQVNTEITRKIQNQLKPFYIVLSV